jgi:hypothetical protein
VPSLSTVIEITLNFSGAGIGCIAGGELHTAVFRSSVATSAWHICCNVTSTMADNTVTTLELWYWMEKWSCVDFNFRVQNRGKFIWPIYHSITF